MHPDKPFTILFEDTWVVVLNKHIKIVVQPGPKKEKHTLTSLLEAAAGKSVYPCHRLDRETTGVILYAKQRKTQNAITRQFKAHAIEKKYIAFVRGTFPERRGEFRDYLIDVQGRRHGEKPKYAHTIYEVRKRSKKFSVISLQPLTGRTHQLRIQLAKHGNPILGERIYAHRKDFPIHFRRLALHAEYLCFIHPVTGRRIKVRAPVPEDMSSFLKKMSGN